MSQVIAIPPFPSGLNCSGSQTTLSRYNGHNQRYLRENPDGQTVFTYAPDGYSVPAEVNQTLVGATTVSSTTETVYLPTASGPIPFPSASEVGSGFLPGGPERDRHGHRKRQQ